MPQTPAAVDNQRLSSGLQSLVNAPELQDVPEGHRLLTALTWRTFSEYQRRSRQRTFVRNTGLFFLWALIGILVVGVSAKVIAPLADIDPAIPAAAIASMTILVAGLLRLRAGSKFIRVNSGTSLDRFVPGRLESIFHPRRMRMLVSLFGLLAGLELAVIHFGHAGMGLLERSGLADQFLLAIDNFCYGALLDIFELYEISLTDPVEHTAFSGTVFLLFRTSFDVLLVFLFFVLFQRRGMQPMLDRFPGDEPITIKALVKWIDRMLIDREAWIRRFPDEMVFLMLVMYCLDDKSDAVRTTAGEWPGLRVHPAVLSRLVNSQNEPLLVDSAIARSQ